MWGSLLHTWPLPAQALWSGAQVSWLVSLIALFFLDPSLVMLNPPEPIASAPEPVQPVLREEGAAQCSSLRQPSPSRAAQSTGLKLSPAMGLHRKQPELLVLLSLLVACVLPGTGLGE